MGTHEGGTAVRRSCQRLWMSPDRRAVGSVQVLYSEAMIYIDDITLYMTSHATVT